MHGIYKIKNKLLYIFTIFVVLVSFYMMKIDESMTAEFKENTNQLIILHYEIYKKNNILNSFSIQNHDYIDTTDMLNEYKKITPLIIDEKNKIGNPYDISYTFYENRISSKMQIQQKISNLDDEEYYIEYNNQNQVILFGKVEEKGYVKIIQNINHLKNIENEFSRLNLNIFIIVFLNLMFMFYLLFLIKNMKLSAINLNEKFEQMHENTKKLAFNDKLTGAATRLKFDVVLEELIDVSSRFEEHKFSVIMLDIDNFKKVNDTLGHDYGDFVLKNVAKVILENIRQSDTFARWGGEEFVILVPLFHREDTYVFADKIRQLISQVKFDKLEQITCSFGVAEFQKGDDEKSIMKRADEFLYIAKKNGKNRVEH